MPPPAYPPRVFKPHLRQILETRGLDPQLWVIAKLRVSNVTAKRILDGCDLRFSRAVRIAKLLDLELTHIWPEA
jgi:hypothetical protein